MRIHWEISQNLQKYSHLHQDELDRLHGVQKWLRPGSAEWSGRIFLCRLGADGLRSGSRSLDSRLTLKRESRYAMFGFRESYRLRQINDRNFIKKFKEL